MQEVLTEDQLKKRKLHRARVSLGCMVLILAVGVVGNWYWENSDISTKISTVSAQRTKTLGEATFVDATTEAATENSYFTQAKLDRQSSRDAALEKLQKIVDTADKSAAAHKEAAQKIAKISELAVGDACTGSNPRAIDPAAMEKLFTCTYYGTEVDF